MTRKQIDTMRETRLWLGQIFVPVALGTMTIMANPELKEKVKEKNQKYRIDAVLSGLHINQIEAQRSGFDLERKKEPTELEFPRLLRKPRKRNAVGFF